MNKSFIIPECAKVTNIKIRENLITVDYEPIEPSKEFIPKDGDFCALIGQSGSKYIFISVNGTRKYYACSNPLTINHFLGRDGTLTHATESEKQLLLSEIDKAGLIWNAEKKRIEKKRWRAEHLANYYLLTALFETDILVESLSDCDDKFYSCGNYFQTSEQAAEFGNLTKELAFHFHQDDEVLTKINELLK